MADGALGKQHQTNRTVMDRLESNLEFRGRGEFCRRGGSGEGRGAESNCFLAISTTFVAEQASSPQGMGQTDTLFLPVY